MSEKRAPGWQQAAVRPARNLRCPHLGVVMASLTLSLHDTGHEWVCGCGQVFVVVSNGGQDKGLVPDWQCKVPAPPAPETAATGEV